MQKTTHEKTSCSFHEHANSVKKYITMTWCGLELLSYSNKNKSNNEVLSDFVNICFKEGWKSGHFNKKTILLLLNALNNREKILNEWSFKENQIDWLTDHNPLGTQTHTHSSDKKWVNINRYIKKIEKEHVEKSGENNIISLQNNLLAIFNGINEIKPLCFSHYLNEKSFFIDLNNEFKDLAFVSLANEFNGYDFSTATKPSFPQHISAGYTAFEFSNCNKIPFFCLAEAIYNYGFELKEFSNFLKVQDFIADKKHNTSDVSLNIAD
jgi:hypothetical protein